MNSSTQNGHRRILVIDDNCSIHEDFRKVLGPPSGADADFLEAEAAIFGQRAPTPFDIDGALQGAEGLEKVRRALAEGKPYALAFVDVRMPPGWDGIETIQRIWEVCPDLQVVICTAYSDCSWKEIQERIKPEDRLLILKKPFDTVEVLQFANSLTEKWRLHQESRIKLGDLDQMVKRRTRELEESQLAVLNMMKDAVRSRQEVAQAYENLKLEVAERKRVEAQFLQAQKMEAVGLLAGGVAHDFNNILTVIQGHSQLLMADERLDPDTLDQLNQISVAAQRAASLTRQLLTFSRKQVMQMKPLDLNAVVRDMTQMLRRLIGEDVTLKTQYTTRPAWIKADTGMLEQLLMNLAVNARDAMPNGGDLFIRTEPVTVDTARARSQPESRTGEFVCLTVQDSGCGMTPEVLARIFEPFFTTKGVGKGTGLGLATAYGIARQHSGWMEVDSEVGVGATFRVFLPVSLEIGVTEQKDSEKHERGGTETILLVEDDAAVREFACFVLERLGYRILEAESGVAALSFWGTHQANVALVITDMIMPDGMTGRELAQRLEASKPGLKLIYTSGYSSELVQHDFSLESGANFLPKPYKPRELAHIVREVLDAR